MPDTLVKRRLTRAFIVSVSVCASFGLVVQSFPIRASAQTDPIASIRGHYAAINRSAARYKKVKKELKGFSTEGGQLIAYFDGRNIMKIAANFYGESGRAAEEYYYWDGKLIFVLRNDYAYSKPFSGKVVRTEVSRFYFTDDQMIRWIDESGKQVGSTTGEFAEKQKEYLDTSKLFTDGARSNKGTIEGAP